MMIILPLNIIGLILMVLMIIILFGITGDFDLSAVLPPSMMGLDAYGMNKHNYIAAFKTDPEFDDIKIGLPAENPSYEPTEDKGPFIVEEMKTKLFLPGHQVTATPGMNVFIIDTAKQLAVNLNLMQLFPIFILQLKMTEILSKIQTGAKYQ